MTEKLDAWGLPIVAGPDAGPADRGPAVPQTMGVPLIAAPPPRSLAPNIDMQDRLTYMPPDPFRD